jgi:hypothetical protein
MAVTPAPRHRCATTWSSVNATTERSRPPFTIGLDLAKHWFSGSRGSTLLERLLSSEGCATRKLSSSFASKTLPRRHGGLRDSAPLGARTDRVGPPISSSTCDRLRSGKPGRGRAQLLRERVTYRPYGLNPIAWASFRTLIPFASGADVAFVSRDQTRAAAAAIEGSPA